MITLGQDIRLGKRAFVFLCLEKSKIPSIALLITVVVVLLKDMLPSEIQADVSLVISFCVVATLFLFLVTFVAGWFEYFGYSFAIGEFDIRVKRGIIKRRETSIPFRNIQNINIERNYSHQMFGLSKIILDTAANEEEEFEKGMSEAVIEAVDKEVAEELRDILHRKIGVQIVRPETPIA
jgi:uncharacterized membrane protein YdbT with pleckstrin-like domain